ncbi:MAG: hypothetical protein EXR86_05815 [Gammaproteobacteria bacterium]|nr:hypothetical protein [Gammaproteobacteria bacterium]
MIPPLHLVMHGVAVRKHSSAEGIAAIAGLDLAQIASTLASAAAGGRVTEIDGKFLLTPAGFLILNGEYSRFYGLLRANTVFASAYDRFEVVNRDLKQIITDWQTIEVGGRRLPNGHTDREYDAKVIDRLGTLHERFDPILAQLVGAVPRLDYYQAALITALNKAEDGDSAWVSEVKIPSYHTVWFELHEDLLRLLGRDREE